MKLAVFLSGTGSNFSAIADAVDRGELDCNVVIVISNRRDAPGLAKASARGIPTAVFDRTEYRDGAAFAADMLKCLREHRTEFIALAGYLRKIPPRVLSAFSGRIVNIHPALLPKFGGKGMYGMSVHRAVIEAGEKESGVSVHFVDNIYDHGRIIARRKVPVMAGDTPEQLAARVLEVEQRFYSEVLQSIPVEFNSGQAKSGSAD